MTITNIRCLDPGTYEERNWLLFFERPCSRKLHRLTSPRTRGFPTKSQKQRDFCRLRVLKQPGFPSLWALYQCLASRIKVGHILGSMDCCSRRFSPNLFTQNHGSKHSFSLYWNRTSVEPDPYNLNLSWCDLYSWEKNWWCHSFSTMNDFEVTKKIVGFKSYSTEWMTHLSCFLNPPDRVESSFFHVACSVYVDSALGVGVHLIISSITVSTIVNSHDHHNPSKSITKVLILWLLWPWNSSQKHKNRMGYHQFALFLLIINVQTPLCDSIISQIYATSHYPWPSEIPHPSILFILPKLGAAQGPNGKNGKIHVLGFEENWTTWDLG